MLFKMKNICFLSMLIASFCNPAHSTDYGRSMSCSTPEGQSGTCIALPQCKHVFDIVQKFGIWSAPAQAFLKPNYCGFEDRDPKVCCSQGKDPVGDRNTNEQTFPPPTTDNWNINWNQQTTTTRRPQYVNPLSLLPRDCGLDESDRIIGGTETALGEFPWTVVLEYTQAGKTETFLGCGGTLITKRHVLTAAHCIRSAPSYMTLTNVRLGEHDTRKNPDCRWNRFGQGSCADPMLPVPVERIIVHESYHVPETHRNDIALLRLAHDVTFTRYIKPICLPTTAQTSENYWAAGWGAMETKRSSDVKLKVNLPYVDANTCASTYRTKKVVLGAGQICAGGQSGKDTCKGDSGGPLMKQVSATSGPNRWVIDGVLSIGHSPCGIEGWPGVFTKVHDYVRWIVSHLES